jgi:hypothetical protein
MVKITCQRALGCTVLVQYINCTIMTAITVTNLNCTVFQFCTGSGSNYTVLYLDKNHMYVQKCSLLPDLNCTWIAAVLEYSLQLKLYSIRWTIVVGMLYQGRLVAVH